ncbi:DUF309 domain-containing protein [Thermoplasma sp.]|uniref:DUF309 domain-containing protein n=1 Tax=Thermoplasma sp. TaxID=1973142 RepID=UPI001283D141|nr:DUF309 domain-containing protein [Thermoplasma sp.]KAA8922637.1 MAG: DUF309 domain-containing protein [Thermoplasma sp.]
MRIRCILFCHGGEIPNVDGAIVRRHLDSFESSFFIDDGKVADILSESCPYAVILCHNCSETLPPDPNVAFRNARHLVLEERFWEAHEALEDAWHVSSGRKKDLIQALIWIIAAQVHWQMGHPDTAMAMHDRGSSILGSEIKFHYPISAEEFDMILKHIQAV